MLFTNRHNYIILNNDQELAFFFFFLFRTAITAIIRLCGVVPILRAWVDVDCWPGFTPTSQVPLGKMQLQVLSRC